MKTTIMRYVCLLLATFLLILIGGLKASAQYSDVNLNELKKKYTWGSIYFAYDPIYDFMWDLRDKDRYRALSRVSGSTVINLLSNFFKGNMTPKRETSIAFLQINMETKQIGFIKDNDKNGVITVLQWGDEEVKQIADLCDHILTGRVAFERVYELLKSKNISVATAWDLISEIRENIFVPQEKITLLLFSYSSLITQSADELGRLKTNNGALYNVIKKFKSEFDKLDKVNRPTPETFIENYYKYLFSSSPSDNPFQKYLTLMDNNVDGRDRREQSVTISGSSPESAQTSVSYTPLIVPGARPPSMAAPASVPPQGAMGGTASVAPQDAIVRARKFYQVGWYDEALFELQRVLSMEPMNSEAGLLAGRIYERRGDTNAAISTLRRAIFQDPKLIDAYILLGRIFLSLGNQKEAFIYIHYALGLDPSNQQAIGLQHRLEQNSSTAK